MGRKNGRNRTGGVGAKCIVPVIIFAALALTVLAVACVDCNANGQESNQNAVSADGYSGSCGDRVSFYFDYSTGEMRIDGRSGSGVMYDFEPGKRPWEPIKDLIKSVKVVGIKNIGNFAFAECKFLTQIEMPDGIKTIGEHAFEGCTSMTSISLSDGIKKIGSFAFLRCSSLSSITIPGTASLGECAFYCCTKLTDVTFMEGVRDISYGIFIGCSSLKHVGMPNTVKSIGSYAFQYCEALNTIDIPDNVEFIGKYAFEGCTSLRNINVGYGVRGIAADAFPNHKFQMHDGTPVAPNDKNFPYHEYKGEKTDKMVAQNEGGKCGDGVKFYFRYSTEELILLKCDGHGDGKLDIYFDWTEIEKSAKTLTIGEGIKNFNGWSFRGFTALEWINVSEKNADYMSKDGILFNKSLSILVKYPAKHRVTEYSIPDTVAEIGDAAFINASVTSVAIPDSVRKINEYAFQNCQSLNSVLIGKGVKEIGGNAFYSSYSLKSVVIPSNVKSIGASAFSYCTGLDYVTIENGVEEIGASAFYSCRSLKAIVIPGSVKVIECCAFYDCVSLKDVEICEGVNRKGVNASIFSIQEFHLHDGTLVKPSDPQFYWRVYHGESVKVPGRPPLIVMKAVNDAGWCGDGVAYNYDYGNHELTIYRRGQGSGEMKIVDDKNPCPWEKYKEEVKKVKFCDGVTLIHNFAFSGFTSLVDVEFAKGLKSIGRCAFISCKSLRTISIPDGIRNIGDSAFYDCPNLLEIKIASDVSGIDSNAFPSHTFYKADGKTVISPKDAKFVGHVYRGSSIDRMIADT